MSYKTEPITMWFDRRLIMRKSPIHGIGTFATENIQAGEMLMIVTGGLVITHEERQVGHPQLEAALYNEEILADNLYVITPKVFHYYINHSCNSNAIDLSRSANSTQYVASRFIQANEEITADYYDTTTLTACSCNSPHCRWTNPN